MRDFCGQCCWIFYAVLCLRTHSVHCQDLLLLSREQFFYGSIDHSFNDRNNGIQLIIITYKTEAE